MRVLLTGSRSYLSAAIHPPLAKSSMLAAGSGNQRRSRFDRRYPAPTGTDQTALGGQMHALIERLYPVCSSITGDGSSHSGCPGGVHPARVHEIPTGTQVLDWTVPSGGKQSLRYSPGRAPASRASELNRRNRGELGVLTRFRPGGQRTSDDTRPTDARLGPLSGPGEKEIQDGYRHHHSGLQRRERDRSLS